MIKAKVAVLVATTSARRNWIRTADSLFVNILLPALERENKREHGKSECTVFLGFDHGDLFYEKHIEEIVCLGKTKGVKIIVVSMENKRKSPVDAWNWLYNAAMAHQDPEFEYFFQTGDDIEFLREGIIDELVDALENKKFRMTWPRDVNNPTVLATQAFVTRKHHEVFGYFFDPRIENWYCDNWITRIYMDTKTCGEIVKDAVRNAGGEPRYAIVSPSRQFFEQLVREGVEKIQASV